MWRVPMALRFKVPVRTINASLNPQYFHHGACATYFKFTSDQFSGLHYLVISGTLKEGPNLLAWGQRRRHRYRAGSASLSCRRRLYSNGTELCG